MRNPSVLCISTYRKLSDQVQRIGNEMGLNVTAYTGGILRNGHKYAMEMEHKYDVIISHGGTFAAIQNLVTTPVVEIELHLANFLQAIDKARNFGKKILLIGYNTQRLRALGKLQYLIDADFTLVPYTDKEDLQRKVHDQVGNEEATLVCMGGCLRENPQFKKCNIVTIECDEEAIRTCLDTVQNIVLGNKAEKKRIRRLKAIFETASDGVVFVEKDRTVSLYSPVAERLMGVSSHEMLRQDLKFMLSENDFKLFYGNGTEVKDELVTVGNNSLVLNRVPIVVDGETEGTVISFQDISKVQSLEKSVRKKIYGKGLIAKYHFEDIVGKSAVLQRAIENAKVCGGAANATVLIFGETGTGKELFAQSMHNVGDRKDGPFVALNCAALPDDLLESELFGYEGGAFTGARVEGKPGMFELAHGGTIFLDEVEKLSLSMQGKLLRELQERTVRRVGGDYYIDIDARVIAATNQKLYRLVKEGKFREDLYFRLNVLNVRLPLLRERLEDIPLLVEQFVAYKARRYGKMVSLSDELNYNVLMEYPWPGNVRELENFVERMVVLAKDSIITNDIFSKVAKNYLEEHAIYEGDYVECWKKDADVLHVDIADLRTMEMQIIQDMLEKVDGNKVLLAQKLGVSRTTLWKKINSLQ